MGKRLNRFQFISKRGRVDELFCAKYRNFPARQKTAQIVFDLGNIMRCAKNDKICSAARNFFPLQDSFNYNRANILLLIVASTFIFG